MKNNFLRPLILASTLFLLTGCKNSSSENKNKKEENGVTFALANEVLTLNLDENYELGYTVENNKGSIKWSSSNPNVVSVSSNKLLAKNEGEAVITAEVDGIKRECTVTVVSTGNGQYYVDSSRAINIDQASDGLVPEFHYYVIENGKRTEILDSNYSFEVKDNAIAKVENGKIIPISVGQTTVKVDYPYASSEFILNVCTKVITKETQFLNMIANKEAGSFFALDNDIDFTGKTYDAYSTSIDLNNYASCFKGTFEGNGYTVKGIKITGKSKNNSIFGCLYNAHIKDVNFENVILENKGAESMAIFANGMTGDDCEIQNVKVSANLTGTTTGNLNLIASKYLESSYTYVDEHGSKQISNGSVKLTNVVMDVKFDGKTMEEANYNIVPEDAYHFRPDCTNVLIYAPGGYAQEIPGISVFSNKLDLIWKVHNDKPLPDTNWDYSDSFGIPSLKKASSQSGLVFAQGTKIEIDPEYEPIKAMSHGAETIVYPYGDHVEGYIYGDHPTEKSTKAVFVNQRWASYAANLVVPAADIDITIYSKVCFFVRTKTFNKSFITIKDLSTGRDYSTLLYDCEVSDKWVKVEMVKVSENTWSVSIGKDKINFEYKATYFSEIPLRFNDARYFYSEMLGVRDPNVTPKNWVSAGDLATKPDGTALASITNITCDLVPSTKSSIVEGSGLSDLAKFVSQDISQASEFKFYVRGAQADGNYFILSLDGSQTIYSTVLGMDVPGLISFNAKTTDWVCFKFNVADNKISVSIDNKHMTVLNTADFSRLGIQLSSGKFYVSEMFCYK